MTKPTNQTSGRGISRRQILKATGGTAALLAAAKLNFPAGAFAQGAGPEVKGAKLGFIALTDAGAAVRRQGKGHLRQIRHARRRRAEAGLLGHHARQPRARLGRQRHRRRAYPDPDAVSDLVRQGDAEQPADADVHPGAAQSERPVHLGRQGIQRPQGRRRHRAVQGRAGEEEGLRQGDQGRDDVPGRHPRSVDPLLARRRRHRSRQGHRNHHRCRRRRWSPT